MSLGEVLKYIVDDDDRTDRAERLMWAVTVPLLWMTLLFGTVGTVVMLKVPSLSTIGTWLTASAGVLGVASVSSRVRRTARSRRSARAAAARLPPADAPGSDLAPNGAASE
jgi:hypothetical protein